MLDLKETVSLNKLDVDNCLLTLELLAALLKCPVKCNKSQSQVIKNKEGIYVLDLKFLIEFSNNLIYSSNYKKMSNLLDTSFNKNYYEYSKILYNYICPNKFSNKKKYFQ